MRSKPVAPLWKAYVVVAALAWAPFAAASNTDDANACLGSIRIALSAYKKSTLDAQHPDMTRLNQMVEFYAAEYPFTYVMDDAKFMVQKFATEMKQAGYHRVNYEVLDVYAEKVSQVCKELIHYTPAEKAERDKWQAEAAKRGGLLYSPSDDKPAR